MRYDKLAIRGGADIVFDFLPAVAASGGELEGTVQCCACTITVSTHGPDMRDVDGRKASAPEETTHTFVCEHLPVAWCDCLPEVALARVLGSSELSWLAGENVSINIVSAAARTHKIVEMQTRMIQRMTDRFKLSFTELLYLQPGHDVADYSTVTEEEVNALEEEIGHPGTKVEAMPGRDPSSRFGPLRLLIGAQVNILDTEFCHRLCDKIRDENSVRVYISIQNHYAK